MNFIILLFIWRFFFQCPVWSNAPFIKFCQIAEFHTRTNGTARTCPRACRSWIFTNCCRIFLNCGWWRRMVKCEIALNFQILNSILVPNKTLAFRFSAKLSANLAKSASLSTAEQGEERPLLIKFSIFYLKIFNWFSLIDLSIDYWLMPQFRTVHAEPAFALWKL